MKIYILLFFLISAIPVLFAQEKVAWKLKLDELEVIGKRKFQDIGTSKTEIDTMILRENVVNSLADILSQNTSIFIKNYGRGTMATASFRGTAPSHTQVLWNGMKINSPMLGQVDFSLIPSYFIDDMSLWHGASSVNVAGGGLGGAITLGNKPVNRDGFSLNFIQGISSFKTYDEFLHFGYAKGKWQSSSRFAYVNSKNDFKYTNYNKKEFDENGNFNKYPIERNKNCNYRDLHFLQEFYYNKGDGNKFSVAAWVMDSRRGIPMLNVNYREENQAQSRQDQTTVRVTGNWDKHRERLNLGGKVGYTFDNMLYTYHGETGTNELTEMMHSNSIVYTGFAQFNAEYFLSEKWMFSANATVNYHSVSSYDKINKTGYDKQRPEVSVFASVRYRPVPRIGLAVNAREDYYGNYKDPGDGSKEKYEHVFTPLVPAAFADILIWPEYNLLLKSSVTKNYHFPTLNDLYFLPGGNPDLKAEKGFTYDAGIEFTVKKGKTISFTGEVTAYNSKIDDWIIWLPTFKGFWEPHNVKKVHSYGWELKGKTNIVMGDWTVRIDGNWSQTRSINQGDPVNWADESIGKQLVYIPEYSSSAMAWVNWKGFTFTYKYNYFSERFTTSSNEMNTKIGRLDSYYMNDISLEKRFTVQSTGISLKFSIYNLLNEEYVSVLSRPMAGRNFGFFIGINPKWGLNKKQSGQL